MRFEDALKAMREGKKVKIYNSRIFYIDKWGDIREDNLHVGYVNYPAELSGSDIMEEDWEIVKDDV